MVTILEIMALGMEEKERVSITAELYDIIDHNDYQVMKIIDTTLLDKVSAEAKELTM